MSPQAGRQRPQPAFHLDGGRALVGRDGAMTMFTELLDRVPGTLRGFAPFPSARDWAAWRGCRPISAPRSWRAAKRGRRAYPALPATAYMDFVRTGDRSRFQQLYFDRRRRLAAMALAESIEGQGRFLDGIIDAASGRSPRRAASGFTGAQFLYPRHASGHPSGNDPAGHRPVRARPALLMRDGALSARRRTGRGQPARHRASRARSRAGSSRRISPSISRVDGARRRADE